MLSSGDSGVYVVIVIMLVIQSSLKIGFLGMLTFIFIFIFRCYLQKRVLNVSRGPAVRALHAQTDKREYNMQMKNVVERQVHIHNFSFCLSFPLFFSFIFIYLFCVAIVITFH